MSGAVGEVGTAPDGSPIMEVALAGPDGSRARVLSWGATLRDLQIPSPDGGLRRVVLGYQDLDSYILNRAYLGATCGRVANRIRDGRFTLEGRRHELARNENGVTHLHGGTRGFSHRPWNVERVSPDAVTLARISPDGEEGYPGTLAVRCTYRLMAPATLIVEMSASTDRTTPVSLAHHSYFTLDPGASVRELEVEIAADRYTPIDAQQLPTGEVAPVNGTPFDLRRFRRLADLCIGVDINYALAGAYSTATPNPEMPDAGIPRLASRVRSPHSRLAMEIRTTAPGLQLYDGGNLPRTVHGLDALPHGPHAGLCFEPQHFPDAVNVAAFPAPWLHPGQSYNQVTSYHFHV